MIFLYQSILKLGCVCDGKQLNSGLDRDCSSLSCCDQGKLKISVRQRSSGQPQGIQYKVTRSEVKGHRSPGKMTLRALPFQFLNLGGEMMYIIDHRLRAQNIPTDRANKGEFCMRERAFMTHIFRA
ncbi:uncharacterized protein LOC134788273, partial [Penaeus indicus]|uniref:uncharacterized protein LOC134788273 n=1 Tax=Penaeus indicus TaxID=29960 RepID=UPI00300D1C10